MRVVLDPRAIKVNLAKMVLLGSQGTGEGTGEKEKRVRTYDTPNSPH